MAASLLAYEVSDLCIGKPPLRPLPLSATVGEALLSLKLCGGSCLSVWAEEETTPAPPLSSSGHVDKGSVVVPCAGKVCMVDVICYLCREESLANPSAALSSPVSALLAEGSAGLVRLVDRHSRVLEALDLILDGAQNLMVPLRGGGGGGAGAGRKRPPAAGALGLCWLTPEDFVRFFLNSIGAFSSVAALSVESLGLVRPDTLAVRYDEPALSAVGLIEAALASQTAVAVVTGDGKLIGEISPSILSGCDETVVAAVATLSAGELMAFLGCGGDPPEEAVAAVKARLRERGMKGLLELVEEEEDASVDPSLSSGNSSSGSSSSSSSSDEELAAPARTRTRGRRRSAATGRWRTEEAVVCHRGSSLVAVMMQALAHRVSYVWVVEEHYELAGVVTFGDVLKVFRERL